MHTSNVCLTSNVTTNIGYADDLQALKGRHNIAQGAKPVCIMFTSIPPLPPHAGGVRREGEKKRNDMR